MVHDYAGGPKETFNLRWVVTDASDAHRRQVLEERFAQDLAALQDPEGCVVSRALGADLQPPSELASERAESSSSIYMDLRELPRDDGPLIGSVAIDHETGAIIPIQIYRADTDPTELSGSQ